jgi:hypothetical protein
MPAEIGEVIPEAQTGFQQILSCLYFIRFIIDVQCWHNADSKFNVQKFKVQDSKFKIEYGTLNF